MPSAGKSRDAANFRRATLVKDAIGRMYLLRYKTAAPLPPHEFQILLALSDGDLHGLGIMQDVLERSEGRIRLWPGMLYRTLQRLDVAGFIAEAGGPGTPSAGSPRYYRLTPAGRRRCALEASRLADLVAVARARRVLRKG